MRTHLIVKFFERFAVELLKWKTIRCLILHQPSSIDVIRAHSSTAALVLYRSHVRGSLEEAKTISHANVIDVTNAV